MPSGREIRMSWTSGLGDGQIAATADNTVT